MSIASCHALRQSAMSFLVSASVVCCASSRHVSFRYGHLLGKIDGRLIKKKRYVIPLSSGLTAELDIFEGDLAPLMLVEVEFQTEDDADSFTAPGWFGEDVTFSGKYHNSYLSRL